jgi:CRP-like cAMP-binding protein
MDLLIKTIQRYIPLSSQDEEIIRKLFRERRLKKGEHLLEAGNICKNVTFIQTGLVRYYSCNNGEEQVTYFNKEGEFVCNYLSFLPQVPSWVNIQALEETTVYTISHADIQLLYKQVEHGERFGRLAIEEVFINIITQVGTLYNDSPEVRYQKFLQRFPDIGQRIPQYYIASYVGVKPQSLSRIRKRIAAGH